MSSRPIEIALVGTAFGFGPVAKACAVSRRLAAIHGEDAVASSYVGDGHDVDFARTNGSFRAVGHADDDEGRALLHAARVVVSFGAFTLPPAVAGKPVVLVDSLGWLWADVPELAERCHTYVVQDFLLTPEDRTRIAARTNLVVCSPILDDEVRQLHWREPDSSRLLVSFGGVDNPVVPVGSCDEFIRSMVAELIAQSSHERITLCVPQRIGASLPGARLDKRVTLRSLPHQEFVAEMATSTLFLSTPGLTASLEALTVGTPTRLLPPLNYSQLRIYEKYGRDPGIDMDPMSHRASLGTEDEAVGVQAVVASLRELAADRNRVAERADQLLTSDPMLVDLVVPWNVGSADGAEEIAMIVKRLAAS